MNVDCVSAFKTSNYITQNIAGPMLTSLNLKWNEQVPDAESFKRRFSTD